MGVDTKVFQGQALRAFLFRPREGFWQHLRRILGLILSLVMNIAKTSMDISRSRHWIDFLMSRYICCAYTINQRLRVEGIAREIACLNILKKTSMPVATWPASASLDKCSAVSSWGYQVAPTLANNRMHLTFEKGGVERNVRLASRRKMNTMPWQPKGNETVSDGL